jgi:hypothetical protein
LLLLLLVVSAFLALSSAADASDISGTVNYYGAKTGRIYVTLSSQYNSSQSYGVSIASSGTYTIRGVPEGGYTLRAYLDAVGNREPHPSDPAFSDDSIYVPANDVSGVNITLDDASPAAPQPPASLSVVPSDGSALLLWEPQRDQNGVHGSDTFDLYWSTNPSFLSAWPTISADGSITGIKSSDNDNGYFHTSLTNEQTYYYLMTGTTGTLVSTGTVTAVMTPAAPVGGYEVSGTITASGFDPSGSTLYAILYSDTDGVFYSIINNPISSQTFTIAGVQDGTFFVYPIYDMNGNGLLDMGDVRPSDGGAPAQVTVSGSSMSGVDATLTAAAGSAMAGTSHWKRDNGCSEGYNINLRAEDGLKIIANVALTSAPTNSAGINGPIDLAPNSWGEFYYYTQTGRPAVGDSFDFAVEYVDGSTETLNAQVTAVLDDFAGAGSPVGVIANEPTPTFTWSAPPSSPAYNYTYQLYLYGDNTNWDMWDMPSSQLSAVYNENGEAYPSTLGSNASYDWTITLRDDDGNEAQTQVNFGMGSGISGTVTDGGAGIACARVEISTTSQSNGIASAMTNPDGTYAVGGIGAGSYKVRFDGSQAGYISQYYSSKTDWTNADTVPVLSGQVTPGIDAVLDQAGSITGQVTNGTSGLPYAWVGVFDVPAGNQIAGETTDENGNYTIGGLPTGTYKVAFGGIDGYASEWYDNASNESSATPVSVTAGSDTSGIDAVLSAGASISGTVTDGTNGIQYIYASACFWDAGQQMCTAYYNATTDSSGNYAINGLQAGQYKVYFDGQSGHTSEWYDSATDMNSATLIGVSTGETVSGINAALTPAGSIFGQVTSDGSAGIANVFISVCQYDGPTRQDCQYGFPGGMTDATGYYTLGGLPAGQYEVHFDASTTGYASEWYNDSPDQTSSTLVSVVAGSQTDGIDAVLVQGGGIGGRVTAGANGIANACVNVQDPVSGNNIRGGWTDPGGYYAINSIPAGNYKVYFGCAEGSGYTGEFYNDKQTFETADLVAITGGATLTNIDAALSAVAASQQSKIGVFRGDGQWLLDLNGNREWDAGDASAHFGMTGDMPVTGDWNGDGLTDPGVFRPAGNWWYLDSNGNGIWEPGIDAAFKFGMAGDVPVTGDWNGDGTTDIGVFRGNGLWALDADGSRTWNAGDVTFRFGMTGDNPVTGDWNGDGTTDVAVYRGNGFWALDADGSRTWNAGDVSLTFGMAGDTPVTGDWNNDGITDIGVFRGNGMWALDADGSRSWNAGDLSFRFGMTGDKPVSGKQGVGGGGTPPPPPGP